MKRQLLLAAFLMGSFFTANAQELTYDFNALTIGNLGTAVGGTTAGQGGWYTFSQLGTGSTTTNNGNTVTQVVANGEDGNGLQLTGPNGTVALNAFINPAIGEFWTGRTAGNNILQVRYSFYTGAAGASTNEFDASTYNSETGANQKLLAGISVNMNTLEVSGVVYTDGSEGVGPYLIGLGTEENPELILPANTWVTLGYDFNTTTGETIFVAPGLTMTTPIAGAATVNTPATGVVQFSAFSGAATNAAAAVAVYDNIVITATGSTAGVDDVFATQFSVYPNPATDVVNVTNVEGLNAIQIVDLNGRTVKSVNFAGVSEASVNVSDLTAGIYMMNIATEKGVSTQKIVKK